jgi:Glycosyltransferase family 87
MVASTVLRLWMARPASALACALICLLAAVHAAPAAAASAAPRATASATTATSSEAPIPVVASSTPPAGRRLSADQVLAIAARLPKMRAVRAEYRGSYGGAYLKGAFHWQVSYFSRGGKKEIGQVIVDDITGRVLEQWTGFQVAWTMARGYPGAFGRHVNALYVWLPLCVLFFVPFFDFRRPFSRLHLDLLVLLSFSVSLAFFNHAHIYASVPLAYPPLLYLLARMLALLRRPRRGGASALRPLRLLIPTPWLAIGVVFLLGFRIGLNVTDSNVIDVGYAGVIGAHRIVRGQPLYGDWPVENEHGDTYGPFNYEAYVPLQQIFGWSGKWDDLPASHAAAIVFDLLAVALLFLLGRRMRGPTLGVALAYAWVSYPFTLFALESNSNDTLVAVLVLAALLAASYRSTLAPAARGGLAALAGLTKFAPLALVPLLATDGLRQIGASRRPRAFALFLLAFAATAAIAFLPALSHDSLHTIYERTIVYQDNRGSPFSVWGLYDLHGWEQAVELAAVALALLLAVIPRRGDLVGLAAACAAVILALQLGIEHWFYLYIPWFFPLAMLALLGRFSDSAEAPRDAASAPARSSLPAALASS